MSIERRGEVWWADLPEDPRGSEPAGRRPVLVISADSFNASRINTVVCAVITKNLRLADVPGNVLLAPTRANGLTAKSVLNVSQIITLNRADLTDLAGSISPAAMRRVESGVRLVLDLRGPYPDLAGVPAAVARMAVDYDG